MMYTQNEAEELSRYYTNRIMGKPIYKFKLKSQSITEIKIEEISINKFDILCYTKSCEGIGFFRDIRSAAKELGLPAPTAILAGWTSNFF